MADQSGSEPPRPADKPPGFDEEDPYEGADLSTYPEWWRRNIIEFRRYGMRPYRPPRCEDGTLMPELISRLEAEHDITIDLRGLDPKVDDDWSVLVDGTPVAEISRQRTSEGYTRYHVTATEFENIVRTAVAEDTTG